MGMDVILASGSFLTFDSALKYRDKRFAHSKNKKMKMALPEEEDGVEDAEEEEEEVEFLNEKTRSERDEEGRANAIVVE